MNFGFQFKILFQRNMTTMVDQLKKKMNEWSFDPDKKLSTLPIDPEKRNFVRRDIPRVIFSEVFPTPFKNKPKIVCTR